MSERDIASIAVSDLTVAQTMSVDIRRLLKAILREFGGEEGLAKELYQEYSHADRGTASKSRILLDVMKLIHAVGPDEDHEEVDIETLTAVAALLMKGKPDET